MIQIQDVWRHLTLELQYGYRIPRQKWDGKTMIIFKSRKRTYKIEFEDGNKSYRNRRKIKILDDIQKRDSMQQEYYNGS